MVYKTPVSCFPVIMYCVKMRKVESINFRFGGRSTSFCSSGHDKVVMSHLQGRFVLPKSDETDYQFLCIPAVNRG